MFEGFPYTNFHELNLDWIIKIARDFLDQYTNIQQTITQGLEDLDTKAQQLQELLDAWYTEHSDDIAQQLADAIQDLNEWYTTHQGYLDQYLTDSISAFTAAAAAEGQRVLDSIPDDYTTLAQTVEFIRKNENVQAGTNLFDIESWLTQNEMPYTKTGNDIATTFNANLYRNPYIFSDTDIPVSIYAVLTPDTVVSPRFDLLDHNGTVVATLDATYHYAAGNASMIRANFGTAGTVTISDLILSNDNISNAAFARSLAILNAPDDYNLFQPEAWFAMCENSYAIVDGKYIFDINARNFRIPYKFSDFDIPLHITGSITPNGGTKPVIRFHNKAGEIVGIYSTFSRQLDITASSLTIVYGTQGSIIADIIINKREIVKNTISPMIPVTEPEGFTWTNSILHNKIFTDGQGNFMVKNFDITSYRRPGPVYYVDKHYGLDTNDGLSFNTPLKTVKAAYDLIEDSGTIIVAPGAYNRTEGTWMISPINKDINIIAAGDMAYFSNMWITSWIIDQGLLTYPSTIVPYNVLDLAHRDSYGRFAIYAEKDSLSDVQNMPGTWIVTGGTLYINPMSDPWADYENIVVTRRDDSNTVIEGFTTFYGENLAFVGGKTPLLISATSPDDKPSAFMKNCEFWGGQGDASYRNALSARGTRLTIFDHCKAMCNDGADGFNYHEYETVSPYAIEIDCVGMFNGDDADGSDQGSTIHEDGKIIRINGVYAFNHGANIGDTGTNAQSWNLGCRCFKSESVPVSQNANFLSYGVDMWLDGCVGYSSLGNIAVRADKIHMRFPRFTGDLKAPQTTGEPSIY